MLPARFSSMDFSASCHTDCCSVFSKVHDCQHFQLEVSQAFRYACTLSRKILGVVTDNAAPNGLPATLCLFLLSCAFHPRAYLGFLVPDLIVRKAL